MDHLLQRIAQLEKEVRDYQLQEAHLIKEIKRKDEELQVLYGYRSAR